MYLFLLAAFLEKYRRKQNTLTRAKWPACVGPAAALPERWGEQGVTPWAGSLRLPPGVTPDPAACTQCPVAICIPHALSLPQHHPGSPASKFPCRLCSCWVPSGCACCLSSDHSAWKGACGLLASTQTRGGTTLRPAGDISRPRARAPGVLLINC